MAGIKCKVDMKGLQKFQQQMKQLNKTQTAQFTEAAIKELAARLLANVIKKTPVGNYGTEVKLVAKRDSKNHKKGDVYTKWVNKTGKQGGHLRRAWTVGEIQKIGDTYEIEIINPTEYAPYVEYGHRTPNHTGWVDGRFMLTISEQELQRDAPQILMNKMNKFFANLGK